MPNLCVACKKDVADGDFCYHDPPIPPPDPPMKLYVVTQEREIFVLATSDDAAEEIARGISACDAEYDMFAREVTSDTAFRVPDDWLDCEPFGDWENLMTVRQWLADRAANPIPDPPQPDPGPHLFPC